MNITAKFAASNNVNGLHSIVELAYGLLDEPVLATHLPHSLTCVGDPFPKQQLVIADQVLRACSVFLLCLRL